MLNTSAFQAIRWKLDDYGAWKLIMSLLAASLLMPRTANGAVLLATFTLWIALVYRKRPDFSYLKNPIIISPLIFFLVHALGLIHTNNLKLGLQYLERIYTFVAFPLVIGMVGCGAPNFRPKVLFIFSLSVISISSLYLFLDSKMLDSLLMINRTYRGVYLLFSATILLHTTFLAPHPRSIHMRIMLSGLLAYNLFLLAGTGAKMPLLIFPVVLIIFIFFYYKGKKRMLFPLMLTIVGVACLVFFVSRSELTAQRFERLITERFDYIRYRNWMTNIELIKESPVIGVGTGDSIDELNQLREDWWLERQEDYNSHNQFLESTVRLGMIGLISLLACVILPVVSGLKKGDFLLLCFAVIFILSCLTESLLDRQKGVLFYSFFLTFLAATQSEYKCKPILSRSSFDEGANDESGRIDRPMDK